MSEDQENKKVRGAPFGLRVKFEEHGPENIEEENQDPEEWEYYDNIKYFCYINNFSPVAVANAFKFSSKVTNIYFINKVTKRRVNVVCMEKTPTHHNGFLITDIRRIYCDALQTVNNITYDEAEQKFNKNYMNKLMTTYS